MSGYDYTASDSAPSTGISDDYCIPDVAAPSKSAEEIRRENAFPDMPPGIQTLVVKEIPFAPTSNFFKVTVNGVPTGFTADAIAVRFSLASNPRCTIDDRFILPPADPNELDAYWHGVGLTQNGKEKPPGSDANRFYHFMGALGYAYPPGGRMSPEARMLRNWKGKYVKAKIRAGTPWTNREGEKVEGKPMINMFSYEAVPAGQVPVAQGQAGGQVNGHQGYAGATPQPHGPAAGSGTARQPVAAHANGLDDL